MKPTYKDLDWIAFRYVAGELTPSETVGFERLLSDDQGARDAVVRAVELSQVILAAESSDQPANVGLLSASRRSWMEHLDWIATGVAAALLVVLALNFGSQSSSRPTVSDDLANAWAQLERSSEAEDFGNENDSAAVDTELVTAGAPTWMVEAVRSLHGNGTPDGDDPNTNDEMES